MHTVPSTITFRSVHRLVRMKIALTLFMIITMLLHENLTLKKKNHNLKCGSLNVCGIKHRLNYPEFCELIQEFDWFCMSETKIDKNDIINLDGYSYIYHSEEGKRTFGKVVISAAL